MIFLMICHGYLSCLYLHSLSCLYTHPPSCLYTSFTVVILTPNCDTSSSSFNKPLQLLQRSRLDHEIIHAALKSLFAGIIAAKTSDSHDAYSTPRILALHVSDRFGSGEAVHDRHRHVHEHQGESAGILAVFLHGLKPIVCDRVRSLETSYHGDKKLGDTLVCLFSRSCSFACNVRSC